MKGSLFRAMWRWHFWSSLLITPVFIIACVTGILLVFEHEILDWLDQDMTRIASTDETIDVPESLRAAHEAMRVEFPDYWSQFINVSHESTHAWYGLLVPRDGDGPNLDVYFDPFTGNILGYRSRADGFFPATLRLHRNLFAGLTGRIIVETATCWGIVSVLTGVYLWWPRKRERFWGVWLPRFRGSTRTLLRDWHTVPGLLFTPFALLLLISGLLFSPIWGKAYLIGNALTGGLPDFYLSPPQSKTMLAEGESSGDVGLIFERAQQRFDFLESGFSIELPSPDTSNAWQVASSSVSPFEPKAIVFVDGSDAEILVEARESDLSWRTRLTLLFYPTHVGTLFGATTQWLALLTSLILAVSAITGIWMWWRRKPAGKWGVPRGAPRGNHPRWLVGIMIALGVMFPTVGVSMLLIWVWEAFKGHREA